MKALAVILFMTFIELSSMNMPATASSYQSASKMSELSQPEQGDVDFRVVDEFFSEGLDYAACRDALEAMLNSARTPEVKTEVLWRLSKVYLLLGENESSKERKAELYDRGVAFAESAIKLDPSNHNSYMWHSANVGRRCQLENVMNQASKVPVMIGDFKKILDTLGVDSCSEAWQGLSEIYWHHPFKSNESAINFARKAAMTIPAGELRLSTYQYLSQLLAKRGWSTRQRMSAMSNNNKKKTENTAIERCAVLDGVLGAEYVPAWADKGLGAMSDEEEAEALIRYARKKYNDASHRTANDEKDYKRLLSGDCGSSPQ